MPCGFLHMQLLFFFISKLKLGLEGLQTSLSTIKMEIGYKLHYIQMEKQKEIGCVIYDVNSSGCHIIRLMDYCTRYFHLLVNGTALSGPQRFIENISFTQS